MDQGTDAEFGNLTRDEFQTLTRLAMKALWGDRQLRRAIQAAQINVIPRNFYSDIPSVEEIERSFEFSEPNGPYNSLKLFKRRRIAEFLDTIAGFAQEFRPPKAGNPDDPSEFFWENPAFSYSDAMAYYAVIRHARPATIIEVGSGFSTLVALEAVKTNGLGQIICIDPFPPSWLRRLPIEIIAKPAQTISLEYLNTTLEDGDILFIDSTHTVKAGSDCLHLYLRMLPFIQRNIMVHAHDIYLPFPLPAAHFDRHIYWTEQYLLLAYLLDNPKIEVLFGSVYNHRFLLGRLNRFMGGKWPSGGASFWFELKGRLSVAAKAT